MIIEELHSQYKVIWLVFIAQLIPVIQYSLTSEHIPCFSSYTSKARSLSYSRKGNLHDNPCFDHSSLILKSEMFYLNPFQAKEELIKHSSTIISTSGSKNDSTIELD